MAHTCNSRAIENGPVHRPGGLSRLHRSRWGGIPQRSRAL